MITHTVKVFDDEKDLNDFLEKISGGGYEVERITPIPFSESTQKHDDTKDGKKFERIHTMRTIRYIVEVSGKERIK